MAIVVALITIRAGPDLLVGVVSVLDGDMIQIHGQQIRLYGIDAPESNQICIRHSSERWHCGQQASCLGRLDRTRNHQLSASRSGTLWSYRGHLFQKNVDLNRWMVANGWAVAYRRYSLDYICRRGHRPREPDDLPRCVRDAMGLARAAPKPVRW
jgi:endonuclease YncB( thermonuclease family)